VAAEQVGLPSQEARALIDPDDRSLTDRCRAGDPGAFAELMDAYRPYLERLAARMGVLDVDGVVQEAFVRLWVVFLRGMGPVRRDRVAGYLRVVLVRSAAAMSQPRLVLTPPEALDATASATDDVDAELFPTYLLAGLSEVERAVVWLCWVEDRSRDEVASLLGLPTGNAVSKHLGRARIHMREALVGPQRIDDLDARLAVS
jgi:DNA-directed RNA polymerase specialized sigma24 family protein